MDKRMIEDHLAETMRHVRLGERHVVRQLQIIEELERDGHIETAAQAKKLLREFEELLTLSIADRDRLLAKLRELNEETDPH